MGDLEFLMQKSPCDECCESDCYDCVPCEICGEQETCEEVECPDYDKMCQRLEPSTLKKDTEAQCCCVSEWVVVDKLCPELSTPVCKSCEELVQSEGPCGCPVLSCVPIVPACADNCHTLKTSAIDEEGCPVYQCVGKTCKPTHVAVVIEEGECPKIECCEKPTTTVPTTTTTTVVPTTTTTVCSYCIDEVSGTRDIGEVWKNAKDPCKTHVCKFSENLCFVDTEITSCK